MINKHWFGLMAMLFFISSLLTACVDNGEINLAVEYFLHKNIRFVCFLSCCSQYGNKILTRKFWENNLRVSVNVIGKKNDIEQFLNQWHVSIGVLLDASCDYSSNLLQEASELSLFDSTHVWLVLMRRTNSTDFIVTHFEDLKLSVDADIIVAQYRGNGYDLTDVFNFGKIQGNNLEKNQLATWSADSGLIFENSESVYYRRWDFHNLTLRCVTVMAQRPKVFKPEMLLETGYMAGVAVFTKIAAQLLNVLMKQHNFRFNYTIAGRWIGSPERNSTLAVTNSLFWREQDISFTSARIFPQWLEWVDIFFPPASELETKFYYLIPDKGVGDYENRFLTPMSAGVWWCSATALTVCALVLAAAARMEGRPKPGLYALFSVLAALCQQAYEDGVQLLEERISSQGRKGTLLVVGVTSMLLYNYYTSSVVSWLLNAAAPTIASLDGLIASDLELVFEDIGYARGWFDYPGFYYFSGYKNPKEDELRDKKVTFAKRTTSLLQPAAAGIDLVRRGGYAYHTEPYTASQVVAKTFEDRELCALASLQMMKPSKCYIMGQKRSPYGKFFTWSMMRLSERGHIRAWKDRVGGKMPACSGRTPRALSLGQAAPAFLLLLQLTLLSIFILLVEIFWQRVVVKNRRQINLDRKK